MLNHVLLEFTNTKLSGLQVRKVDSVTKEPLQGVKFRVTKMNGEYVGDYVTGVGGYFAVSDLEPDWYTAYETATIAGYVLDATPQNIQIKKGALAVLDFENKPLSGLQIRKTDSVTGLPLSGVEFKVTELSGRLGMFGDSHCECEPERRSMLRLLNERGGVYIHLPQEAQGMGLFYKAQELHLQVSGIMPDGSYVGRLPQNEAAKKLTGNKVIDSREYTVVGDILGQLGLLKYTYELVTKNPSKITTARHSGISVSKILDSSTVMTADNLGEYLAKWWQKGYPLTAEDMTRITNMLNSTDIELPPRAVNLLNEARFTLETDENSITSKIMVEDEKIRVEFVDALRTPKNESVKSGGKLQMWSLLERAEAYDEFQYELVLSEELDNYLAANCNPEGQVRLWHEKNYYLYPPYATTTESRDLKIRLTFDMKERFLAARLIHKIKKRDHFYQIRSINFSDPAMFELMRQTVFKDYDQEFVESITYPYCYPDRGMKIIIKRYSDGQRTLSLEGNRDEVISWKNSAQDAIDKLLEQVKHNRRSFAPKISAQNSEFNLDQFMKDEFIHCRRYFNYE